MKKSSPELNDAIVIARETMLQLFISGDQQIAKGAERVWRKLIIARNCVPAVKYNSGNVIDFPLVAYCE